MLFVSMNSSIFFSDIILSSLGMQWHLCKDAVDSSEVLSSLLYSKSEETLASIKKKTLCHNNLIFIIHN